MPPLMEARDLRRYYLVDTGLFARKGTVRAVDGVSFTLDAGQTLAVGGAAASQPWRAWRRCSNRRRRVIC